jgi:hypothetical protein
LLSGGRRRADIRLMSFLIDTLYGILGLTDAEKAEVNLTLPYVKNALDLVDAHLDDVKAIQQLLITNKKPIAQLLADWAVVGPNLSSATVDGPVDLFGTMGAYNDVKAVIAANPKNVAAITALYNKLLPVINGLIADWPKIKPAVTVIMGAAHRGNVSPGDVVAHLNAGDMRNGG